MSDVSVRCAKFIDRIMQRTRIISHTHICHSTLFFTFQTSFTCLTCNFFYNRKFISYPSKIFINSFCQVFGFICVGYKLCSFQFFSFTMVEVHRGGPPGV